VPVENEVPMTDSHRTSVQGLIDELDQITKEAERTRDFQGALKRLHRWKDLAATTVRAESTEGAARDLANAGNFHTIFSGDFTTLDREVERHRRVLVKLKQRVIRRDCRADFVVISIREDEAEAVLRRLSPYELFAGEHRTYAMGQVQSESGLLSVAAVRTTEQANLPSQDTARDAIEDLHPRWLVVVGICGAVPDSEFTLGDVVVASRLHALTRGTYKQDSDPTFDDQGGAMVKKVQDLVVSLKSLEPKLVGWNTKRSIRVERPTVSLGKNKFYGEVETCEKTRKTLSQHFAGTRKRTKPIFTDREVVAGDFLIKDTLILKNWQKSAPHMATVDMELAGIYSAARRMGREYPVLSVRGISDVIGFQREKEWTRYACETAAAFFFALLKVFPKQYL
jgi:nucleoside phosphorylase